MCGIAGWIDWDRDVRREAPVVAAMGEVQASRGPDASGLWIGPTAGLAHRRLIVVDPEGGDQPMTFRRGRETYVIVYNGELYNGPEVRRELKLCGYSFRGHCDTELVLLAYAQWGPACLNRLNGMFAFAIWEDHNQRLFLARDRLGVKPLFFAPLARGFLFASEIKGLLAHPDIRPEVDAEGLAEVFALGPARTPGHGVFRGIRELKPGQWMHVERQGMRVETYWRLESRPHADDPGSTVATVRELLSDAVGRQLVADVPVCTLLSGGVDSSALTALAARSGVPAGEARLGSDRPVDTWSVTYRDNDRYFRASDLQPADDGPWIRLVSEHLGTRHHTVVIDQQDLAGGLVQATLARDLPGMADIDASLYLFCREIRREFTVALSGECADEIFGGYPWFRNAAGDSSEAFPWSRQLSVREEILSPAVREVVRPREYVRQRLSEALEEVPRLEGEDESARRIRELFYLNITRWMPTLLDRKDRMSMAVGLEVRVPYCDHRLVEYVWNVPWEMKCARGREKGLLRQAMAGLLPEEVLWRKKSPYPKTYHPAYGSAVRDKLTAILADPDSPLNPLIHRPAVERMLSAGPEMNLPWFGQLMNATQLWAYLVQVDTWLRRYRIRIRI
ncbi:MAG: asparagine synthase (glutamine-hydrolyzing) [Firmicutes bacterium]|nr:asparagine synthase (glutamine-hydrolyzing) [Bacillota bacterium]